MRTQYLHDGVDMMMVVGFIRPEWGMKNGGEVRLMEVWLCQDEGW